MSGRRNGRTSWVRWQIEQAAQRGEHVHYLARDGLWCVTRQPLGLLWARVEPD